MIRRTFFKYLPLGIWVLFNTVGIASPTGAQDKVDVLIGFKAKPVKEDLDVIKSNGGKIKHRFKIIPSVAASVPAKAVAKLLGNPRVKIVELDSEVKAHDIDQTWGVQRIGCGPVHDGTFMTDASPVLGANVKVAVLDTGIDYTHSQLMDVYKGGYDFVNNDSDPFDDQYHGTHCAGTIAAKRDGIAVVGAAPEVDLYSVKVLNSRGSGSWSGIIAGMDWCVDNGMDVASLSLGGGSDPGSQVRAAFDNAYAAGVCIVSSAGNSGAGSNTVGFPARYDSVIAVASTTSSDTRSSFSSTGPAVEIAAPGSSVLSTYPGEQYAYLSGTSMACPHVAGVAALMISAGVTDLNNDGNVNDEVRAILQATADDLGTTGRDENFGFGLVDADGAVTAVFDGDEGGGGDPPPPPTFDPPTNLFGTVSGNTVSLSWEDNSEGETGFEVEQGIKSKKTISWTTVFTTGPDATTVDLNVPNGKYYYRVRAIKQGDATGYSNSIQLTVGKQGGGRGR